MSNGEHGWRSLGEEAVRGLRTLRRRVVGVWLISILGPAFLVLLIPLWIWIALTLVSSSIPITIALDFGFFQCHLPLPSEPSTPANIIASLLAALGGVFLCVKAVQRGIAWRHRRLRPTSLLRSLLEQLLHSPLEGVRLTVRTSRMVLEERTVTGLILSWKVACAREVTLSFEVDEVYLSSPELLRDELRRTLHGRTAVPDDLEAGMGFASASYRQWPEERRFAQDATRWLQETRGSLMSGAVLGDDLLGRRPLTLALTAAAEGVELRLYDADGQRLHAQMLVPAGGGSPYRDRSDSDVDADALELPSGKSLSELLESHDTAWLVNLLIPEGLHEVAQALAETIRQHGDMAVRKLYENGAPDDSWVYRELEKRLDQGPPQVVPVFLRREAPSKRDRNAPSKPRTRWSAARLVAKLLPSKTDAFVRLLGLSLFAFGVVTALRLPTGELIAFGTFWGALSSLFTAVGVQYILRPPEVLTVTTTTPFGTTEKTRPGRRSDGLLFFVIGAAFYGGMVAFVWGTNP